MHKFVRDLITAWRRIGLPSGDAAFVVAVSGGADSAALLLAIEELQRAKKLKHRFVAAHFNHHLRGVESDADEQFVKALCGTLEIELAIGHGDLPDKGNLEQNARTARYDFLKKKAENIGAQAVLTAHTQNDQAETFLMNLIRGSGPDGLGGMRITREMLDDARNSEDPENGASSPLLPFSSSPTLLIRPLLGWARRQATEGYCHDRQVEYRYDSMNEDLNFVRVRIRKLLLPMLEEFNPKIVETIANTAFLMQARADHNDRTISATADELSVAELKRLEKADVFILIRSWIIQKRGDSRGLSLKHIQAVERLALSGKSGRVAELPNGVVVKKGGVLVYRDLKVEKTTSGA